MAPKVKTITEPRAESLTEQGAGLATKLKIGPAIELGAKPATELEMRPATEPKTRPVDTEELLVPITSFTIININMSRLYNPIKTYSNDKQANYHNKLS